MRGVLPLFSGLRSAGMGDWRAHILAQADCAVLRARQAAQALSACSATRPSRAEAARRRTQRAESARIGLTGERPGASLPAASPCTACQRAACGACGPPRRRPSRGRGWRSQQHGGRQQPLRRMQAVASRTPPGGTQLHHVAHELQAQQHPAATDEGLGWESAPAAVRGSASAP